MSTIERSRQPHRSRPSAAARAPRPPAGRARLGDHDFGLRATSPSACRGT